MTSGATGLPRTWHHVAQETDMTTETSYATAEAEIRDGLLSYYAADIPTFDIALRGVTRSA
jgi:hypothetical protein